ncbi:16S rRNA (guanine(527)-N(7))-methyltransferase RsmG [Persicimonas caeni]|uniref:Ribosomal RNA small subunit methyltransferase G n=1 Tax=Persicimonas caeni TaxID=2292766 RepID=A0A4Y6PSE2_PERCE|nr:16S rRNA (guanine(527)-N(7))-methyltransferase RsmG [Persicimonas caeni]QDG51252.1 16S rRNA (guanine(527)-N(7))-methyltransferase RsmG [Persicimonas caeni]QED32473.1 16S rRNA (guanine(527)-N(7))-methyltransferase RsmG [Persicimonas caeni]
MPLQKLQNFCTANNLPWTDEIVNDFATYLELLTHFNKVMNLIGPMSEGEVVDQLLIDSVAAAAVCAPQGPILDVGSGAGLPGVPLKLLYPDLPITLVEPRQKRTTFLKIVLNRLDLADTTIERKRIEEVERAEFSYVISKAFQPPVQWLETASEWTADEGVVMCLTRPDERAALEAKAGELGLELAGACDDTTVLGAPSVGDVRAIYAFGQPGE